VKSPRTRVVRRTEVEACGPCRVCTRCAMSPASKARRELRALVSRALATQFRNEAPCAASLEADLAGAGLGSSGSPRAARPSGRRW